MKRRCPICLEKFNYYAEYDNKCDVDLCKKCDDKENERLKVKELLILYEQGFPIWLLL